MRIEIRGRNVEVTDELREHVEKRFARIGRQVADPAQLDVELSEERNPAISDRYIAEATLYLKGDDAARPRGDPRDDPLDPRLARRTSAARSSATARSAASARRRGAWSPPARPRRSDAVAGP